MRYPVHPLTGQRLTVRPRRWETAPPNPTPAPAPAPAPAPQPSPNPAPAPNPAPSPAPTPPTPPANETREDFVARRVGELGNRNAETLRLNVARLERDNYELRQGSVPDGYRMFAPDSPELRELAEYRALGSVADVRGRSSLGETDRADLARYRRLEAAGLVATAAGNWDVEVLSTAAPELVYSEAEATNGRVLTLVKKVDGKDVAVVRVDPKDATKDVPLGQYMKDKHPKYLPALSGAPATVAVADQLGREAEGGDPAGDRAARFQRERDAQASAHRPPVVPPPPSTR